VGEAWWREVFILAAGYLAGKPGFAARNFLQQIADQGETPAARLAALALAARGLLQLQSRLQRPNWYGGLAQELAGKLYDLLYVQKVSAPVAVRQDAGLALGLLHGYPGEDGLGDPRFQNPCGLPDFVRVKGGEFWMGDDRGLKFERPCHQVYLDSFELARFPTTNAMFSRFIAAGGYENWHRWVEATADRRRAQGMVKDWSGERNRPVYWDDDRFNNPAQPVVGVTWYEAVAYCAWLTATLDDGYVYCLPSEAQWERAARGSGGSRYPWGDQWLEDHCNSKETGLETTSPVGIFPRGVAQGGIEDMVGNIWEWCYDWYGRDYYAQSQDVCNPIGPDKGTYCVFRGGSWYDAGPIASRCGSRDWVRPEDWGTIGGFRCARILS
jgi:formylglycine-generating enzyme required for sulfatase activity